MLLVGTASAGTITLNGSNMSVPTVSLQGNVTQDAGATLATQDINNPSGDTVKIMGDAAFTSGGGDSLIRISLAGTFSARSGDRFFADYDFSATLNEVGASPGSITYAVTGSASVTFFPPFVASSTGGPLATGPQSFQGFASSPAIPFNSNGTFTGFLEINWQDALPGDKLVLSIPNNSIDFTLSPVPEPSALTFLALSLPLIANRRRRS